MENQIWEYFQRELRFLRDEGEIFGRRHREDAGLLDFSASEKEDPFVRRLVQSFAFLTARVQMKLDSDFPQVAAAMLDKVLPLATKVFPAFSICEFEVGDQIKPGGEDIPKRTVLRLAGENNVQFRTCYDTRCLGLELKECEITRNLNDLKHDAAKEAPAALKMTFQGMEGLPLNAAVGDKLTLFISDQDYQYEISEMLFNPQTTFAIGIRSNGKNWQYSSRELRILGFDQDEMVLPVLDGMPMEYQILMEMFAYPAKHMFFEVPLPKELQSFSKGELEVFFFVRSSNERLEGVVNEETFRLNCVPVVNLFETPPVSVNVDRYCMDTLVDPNSGNSDFEVFDIGRVMTRSEDGEETEAASFYSVEHDTGMSPKLFSQQHWVVDSAGERKAYISFVDTTRNPVETSDISQAIVSTVCYNRRFHDIARITDMSTRFKVVSGGVVDEAKRLGKWQRHYYPGEDSTYFWNLISILNLNILLVKETGRAETLQRMLRLLDRTQLSEFGGRGNTLTESWIDSVAGVNVERSVERINESPWPAIVDGNRVTVSLSASRNSNRPGSWFVFVCALNHFFSVHAAVNSFTQLDVKASEEDQPLTSFSKRCGTRILI